MLKKPTLVFSLNAYRKIMLANGYSGNEVTFYGITDLDDCLRVNDVFLPVQTVSGASCEIDDESVQKYAADYISRGYMMRQLTRVWIHTHPSGLLTPSGTDESTFNNILGVQDLAIMVIVEKGGKIAAWLQLNNVDGLKEPVRITLETELDYSADCRFREKGYRKLFDKMVGQRTYYRNNFNRHCANKAGFYGGGAGYGYLTEQERNIAGADTAAIEQAEQDESIDLYVAGDQCRICMRPLKFEEDYAQCSRCGSLHDTCPECAETFKIGNMSMCEECEDEYLETEYLETQKEKAINKGNKKNKGTKNEK